MRPLKSFSNLSTTHRYVLLVIVAAWFAACGSSKSQPSDAAALIGACAEVSCSDHGTCIAQNDVPICKCDRTYVPFGLHCISEDELSISYTIDDTEVNGFDLVDLVSWRDSKGLNRIAYFARLHTNSMFPNIVGYITKFIWQPDESSDPIHCSENVAGITASGSQGWGMNVMHLHYTESDGFNPYTGNSQPATSTKRDGFDFEQKPLFLGPHHMIFRTTYKQYTTLHPGTPGAPEPDNRKAVKVTIDWAFFSGLDYFIYALTIDSTDEFVADEDPFRNDLRTPYCLFSSQSWANMWDWSGVGGPPDGQSWGDDKKFITEDMQHWTYTEPNTVPYVWEWVHTKGDAEAGFVSTETYNQKQAGSRFNDGQSASGDVLPGLGGAYQGYSYQMNYYEGYQSKKLTWGMPYGAIDGGYGSTMGYQNYALAMHFGKHSEEGVSHLLAETEAFHDGTISVVALQGIMVTEGPEGSGNPTVHTYSPPGYNHVYRTWEINAPDGAAEMTIETGAKYHNRPVFVVLSDALAEAESIRVTLNDADLTEANGCFISQDTEGGRVFITLPQGLSGTNNLLVDMY